MDLWRVKSDFSLKEDFRRQAGSLIGFLWLDRNFLLAAQPPLGNVCLPEK
jgi:hypothetical protein